MKISQISEYSLPSDGGLPPLQAMIYEELIRRPDEVFEYQGDELIKTFPRLKRSALNWSLWLLAKTGHVSKMRVRVNGRLTTVYGAHEAIAALKIKMGIPDQNEMNQNRTAFGA
ncbi:MAG: hypothetical protein CL763_06590 [Chloroflexi bacterium]|nr:hypothetical protein [Chloroflexota bacterium]|tara:strand:+ start:1735 stop:2076 length:342 start_codon:yes stop_codon:yes gene_type:complete